MSGDKSEIRVWDVRAEQCISSTSVDKDCTIDGITALPGYGKLIATTFKGAILWYTIWKHRRPLLVFGDCRDLHAVAVSPASRKIPLAAAHSLKIWDVVSERHIAILDLG